MLCLWTRSLLVIEAPSERKASVLSPNRFVPKFIASLENVKSSDEVEQQIANAMDDIFAHFIHIEHQEDGFVMGNENEKETSECFCHLATIEDKEDSTAFIARL